MNNKMTLSEQIVNLEIVQETMDAARARQRAVACKEVARGAEVGQGNNTEATEN
jgi:hypothetical protein